ncbi:MAG: TRL-like family protein [Gammaproteobacteria bacterium]|nr:TRL-like family protein [Gammaproteobacteria bacterium]
MKSILRPYWILMLIGTITVSGCGLLYTDIRLPRAYRSATPSDVRTTPNDTLVTGEACNRSALFLVAWGDASYATAAANAAGSKVNTTLYDVKADVRATSILLGLYSKICTVVTGKLSQQ